MTTQTSPWNDYLKTAQLISDARKQAEQNHIKMINDEIKAIDEWMKSEECSLVMQTFKIVGINHRFKRESNSSMYDEKPFACLSVEGKFYGIDSNELAKEFNTEDFVNYYHNKIKMRGSGLSAFNYMKNELETCIKKYLSTMSHWAVPVIP